jgi:hypothetical protein
MNNQQITPSRRSEAVEVLKKLLRYNQIITPDILYIALQDNGFNEDERCRLAGAILRTAKAHGWTEKTPLSVRSKRNHSNHGTVWKSLLYAVKRGGNTITDAALNRERRRWLDSGYLTQSDLVQFAAYEISRREVASNPELLKLSMPTEKDCVGTGIGLERIQ